jgi:seryl-tRNA synthetase
MRYSPRGPSRSMLDLHFIRENPEVVREAIRNKKFAVDLDALLDVDGRYLALVQQVEAIRSERNRLSKAIPGLGKEERPAAIAQSKTLGEQVGELETQMNALQVERDALLLTVPNIPVAGTPVGAGEHENAVVRHWGEPRKFDFTPRDHIELCRMHKLADFERPSRFAGSRAYALTGFGVLLEQSLMRFALDLLVEQGFTLVAPPVLVREEAMIGTGFFPLGYEDTYRTENKGALFLIGTSEVSLVSMHADEIFEPGALPIRYAGISPCFRREAGAAGRDTAGLYRVHQFNKVEQVVFCEPDAELSLREHLALLGNSETILQRLELPHRVALACTGELGLGQVRKHEVETWMPSRNAYAETHSCSTLYEFQSRRSRIRVRLEPGGKPVHVHTLNNTALASPRILIPVLEHYQDEDGSIRIPKALQPYLGGRERLEVP